MNNYIEKKIGNRSVFLKTFLNENKEVSFSRQVSIPLYQIDNDGFTYFVLYDDMMKPVTEVYEYLNFHLRSSPINSRRKAAFALRLLYCFLSLASYSIDGIGEKELRELIFFLRGLNSNPEPYSLKTLRSNETVNGYLSVYRTFFNFAGIKCDALFRGRSIITEHVFEDAPFSSARMKYDNNLLTSDPYSYTVPKYISPIEFKAIYTAMARANDVQAQLIVHLMYGFGLRLGEVLGLTIEDVTEIKSNGKLFPVLYLRNRISDKKFQFAKNLPHVIDPRQYESKDYQDAKTKVIISYELYERLLAFADEQHTAMSERYPENYASGEADIVSLRNKPDYNHYLFLNRYGRILSDQTWNNSLKRYFRDADIPLDIENRESNLSHRFRHGYAMFHARFSERSVNVLELQKMMRHKSISSTMVYYNPTPEDEYEIKTEFLESLYGMIPELKEGFPIENE